jgi:hypothetical protein
MQAGASEDCETSKGEFNMLENQRTAAITPVPNGSFAPSAWTSARIFGRMDSEMAAWLRMHLFGAFSDAKNWDELNKKLHHFGFYLQRKGAQMWLLDCHSHVEICTCSFLGFPSSELKLRLGTVA